jgi:hypothetical protein
MPTPVTVTVPGVTTATLKWNNVFVPMTGAGGTWAAVVTTPAPAGQNVYQLNVLSAPNATWSGTVSQGGSTIDSPGGMTDDTGHDKYAGAC